MALCGTYRGYLQHHREQSEVCEECREANRQYRKSRHRRRVGILAVPYGHDLTEWVLSIPYHPKAGQAKARTFAEIQPAAKWLADRYATESRPVIIETLTIKYPKET